MRSQQGFTLIELMIVIVIIGVLAMFAIPQFQNRTISAQVNRVIMETSQLRTAVELCQVQGITETDKCSDTKISSELIKDGNPEISLDKDSPSIKATFDPNNAATALHGKQVIWKRIADKGWQCTTDVEEKYSIKGCNTTPTPTAQ
ncbi:pilin [Moraxella nasicaprae]|uniref:Pilin n=1 Tax=Moraxella nasicaprae TaxID=2904122 RepID=A0ABY6F2N5_9GAMM|nr:pilin [Moraxella nasicaprae]UXZ04351.1 pilin [Moraxella nasicaprae]